jgi:hypothetical protein
MKVGGKNICKKKKKKKKRIRECKTSTSLQTERKKSYWPSKNRMEAETEIGSPPPPLEVKMMVSYTLKVY